MTNKFNFTAVILSLLLAAAPVAATVIYDSGVSTQTPPQAGVIFGNGTTVANRFNLAANASLASVSFYTLECCGISFSGTMNYDIFTDNGEVPSSVPIAQGNNVFYVRTSIYSDTATNVVERNDFNLTIPINLNAGVDYWIGIALSGTGAADPSWNAVLPFGGVSARATNGTFDNWGLQGQTGAFQLFNTPFAITPVPEPGSSWMFLAGFGLLTAGYSVHKNGRLDHAVKWFGDKRRAADNGMAAGVEVGRSSRS